MKVVSSNLVNNLDFVELSLHLFCFFFRLFLEFFLVIITFIYQITKRHDAIKFLHLLNDFDCKAKFLHVKHEEKKSVKSQIFKMITIAFTFHIINCSSSIVLFFLGYNYNVDIFFPAGYGYTLSYLITLVVQFSLAALALKRRFRLLNDNLVFAFGTASATVHHSMASTHLPLTITELYTDLCLGIDTINSTFTLQLIPFVIMSLSTNLFSTYSMIREIFLKTVVLWATIGNTLWWLLFFTGMLSVALYSAHTTTKCARQTPIIVGGILKSTRWHGDEHVVGIFKTFLLEVQHHHLHFENEFFRIEWKLLFSVSL
jgi:hypothetical protein